MTKSNPWLVLAIISSALLLIGIDMTVLNVALPSLSQQLGATTTEKLWMVNAYSLVMAGLLPGFGTLADRVGSRTILIWGLIVFGVSSTLAAFAPSPTVLIAARGLLAVGAAMMMPATLSIVRLVFRQDQERATAIGIWGAVWAGAAALGPIIGGILLEHFWWGAVFLINVPIVIVTLVLALTRIPHVPGNPDRRWDALTSAYLTISLIALLYGLKGLLKPEIHWYEVLISAALGIVFGWRFLHRQTATSALLIDFKLFQKGRFSLGATVALVAGFSLMGVQYILSQELQLVRGLSPLQAGLFVLPIALASFVSGPAVGGLMLRVGMERMMAIMMGLAALGVALYTYSGHLAPMVWEMTTMGLIGLGMGGGMAVASTAIMMGAPEEQAGMAGSIESISYELGGTLGVAVMGSVMASSYATSFAPPAEANLPASAWDSIDQTLLALTNVATATQQTVVSAVNAAFLNGVDSALFIGTTIMVALFVGTVAFAWGKKGDVSIVHH